MHAHLNPLMGKMIQPLIATIVIACPIWQPVDEQFCLSGIGAQLSQLLS